MSVDLADNFIDETIEWIKKNSSDQVLLTFVNNVNKKQIENYILWYVSSDINGDINENILIRYNTLKNNQQYETILPITTFNKNIHNYDLVINSDYCKIISETNYVYIYTKIPDFMCIIIFMLNIEHLQNINGSIFYKKTKPINNLNYSWIETLLQSKSYSLIITRYSKQNAGEHHKLSMYLLLNKVYDNEILFETAIKYLILQKEDIPENNILSLNNYLKTNFYGDYAFMHKYILKTPEFVIKNFIHCQHINNNMYQIKWSDKNYMIRYELGKISSSPETTTIKLIAKIFISNITDESEINILNYYLNKINVIEQVIFYERMKQHIKITNYFVNYMNETHNSNWFAILDYDTYCYTNWINKYFGGSICDYMRS